MNTNKENAIKTFYKYTAITGSITILSALIGANAIAGIALILTVVLYFWLGQHVYDTNNIDDLNQIHNPKNNNK